MDSSLTRSLVAGMDDESREEKLYAGQTFEHTLSIVNSSSRLTVRKATLSVEQPKVRALKDEVAMRIIFASNLQAFLRL